MLRSHVLRIGSLLALLVSLAVAVSPSLAAPASVGGAATYQEIKLVSDLPNVAKIQDPNLVNAWGLSHTPTSPWWVSDNGTGKATLYTGDGTPAPAGSPLVVTIPSPSGGASAPTGNVFNNGNATDPNDFRVSENSRSGASIFIFATEDGTIAGWNRNVDLTNAIIEVDRSQVDSGAVYKGLAIGRHAGQQFIYATNFRFGTVEMFDGSWKLVRSFTDNMLAGDCPLPGQCYAPFGIQNINGNLFVTYALQDSAKHDDQAGAGRGFVDVFDTGGNLLRRFAAHGKLNSPWGLALAPGNFGRFSNALLVGNFGDGHINAFNSHSGTFLGQLQDHQGNPIEINGLWGIAFGNGAQAGKVNELFFASGLNDEADGLFGKIVRGD